MIFIILVVISIIFNEGKSSMNQISLESSYPNKQNQELYHSQISNQLLSFTNSQSCISTNDVCRTNISQSNPDYCHTIKDALLIACNQTDGYEFTIIDSNHSEHLIINQNSTIYIIRFNSSITTVWITKSVSNEIILIQDGKISLELIEFGFLVVQNFIQPSRCLAYICGNQNHPSLIVIKCTFQSISQSNANSIFNISNNTFTDNSGKYSGALFLKSENTKSNYIFNNNIFTSNHNNQKDNLGADAYLIFSNTTDDWTPKTTKSTIKQIFNGCQTNAQKAGIYYEIYKDDKDQPQFSGSIIINEHGINGCSISGIVVGSIFVVSSIIILIVIICLAHYRKIETMYNREKEYLISRLGLRSV